MSPIYRRQLYVELFEDKFYEIIMWLFRDALLVNIENEKVKMAIG